MWTLSTVFTYLPLASLSPSSVSVELDVPSISHAITVSATVTEPTARDVMIVSMAAGHFCFLSQSETARRGP